MVDTNVNKEQTVNVLNDQLSQANQSYKRPQMQTYMTAPEWRNVDMAGEFASFSKTQKPFYLFPYFSQTFVFWQILVDSAKAAHKDGTPWKDIIFSEFFMMDVFIGTFTTVEYLIKGTLSLPGKALAFLTGHKQNKSDTQTKLTELFDDYAKFIHHTPFYDYKYTHWVPKLWSTFYNSSNKTFDDFISLLYFSIELPLKGLVAAPVAWVYNSESNQAYETIDVLISYETTQNDKLLSKEEINHKLDTAFVSLKEAHANAPKPSSEHLSDSANNGSYGFIKTTLPRYEPLMTAIQTLNKQGFKVERIAGQEKVQLKCRANTDMHHDSSLSEEGLCTFKEASILYHYSNSIDSHFRYVMLDVATEKLNCVIDNITESQTCNLVLIHDF